MSLVADEYLIKKCGYHRRDEELADAKQPFLRSKSANEAAKRLDCARLSAAF